MGACPFSAMVHIHGCASKVEEVSTFHETCDIKITMLTFLSQANIYIVDTGISYCKENLHIDFDLALT